MIIDATFVSVWDDGFEIETTCKVNTDTKRVFNIKMVDPDNYGVEIFHGEHVCIDGIEYDVYSLEDTMIYGIDAENDDYYWYDYSL